jgi:3'-phosphoadenosine 5'-phosphosulfate (PAPS) 3'-phosphatase
VFRRKDRAAHCGGNGSRGSRNKLGPIYTDPQGARDQQRAYHARQDRPIWLETAATFSREKELADRTKQDERNVAGCRFLAGVFKKRSTRNESHGRNESKKNSKRDSGYKACIHDFVVSGWLTDSYSKSRGFIKRPAVRGGSV